MKRLAGQRVHSLRDVREAVSLRRGGRAQVLEYQAGHQWLTLRLVKPGLAGNFHLRCGACERVTFETQWEPASVEVEEAAHGFVVHDGAHLRVECGLVEGEYNVPPVFGLG